MSDILKEKEDIGVTFFAVVPMRTFLEKICILNQ